MINLKSVFEITVPEYIPMAVLGAFVGVVATTKTLPNALFIELVILLICIVAGFNTFNAISDKKIDLINKPTRPLPSNKLTVLQAEKLTIFFYLTAILLSVFINPIVFGLTILMTILTVLYSLELFYLKKRFVIGNLVGAVLYAILCPLAGWALTPTLEPPLVIILILFLLAIGLSFLKDFEDVVGDKKYGIATLPLKIGRDKSIFLILSIVTIAFISIAYLISLKTLPEKNYFLLIFYPLLFFNIYSYKKPQNHQIMAQSFRITVTLIMAIEITIALLTII